MGLQAGQVLDRVFDQYGSEGSKVEFQTPFMTLIYSDLSSDAGSYSTYQLIKLLPKGEITWAIGLGKLIDNYNFMKYSSHISAIPMGPKPPSTPRGLQSILKKRFYTGNEIKGLVENRYQDTLILARKDGLLCAHDDSKYATDLPNLEKYLEQQPEPVHFVLDEGNEQPYVSKKALYTPEVIEPLVKWLDAILSKMPENVETF